MSAALAPLVPSAPLAANDNDGNFKRVKSAVNGKTIYNIYNLAGELAHVDEETANRETDYVRLSGSVLMRLIRATLFLFYCSLIVACTATETEKSNNNLSYNNETVFPIDTEVNPADSVFSYPDIIEGGIGEKNSGKMYWYLKDRAVLNSDVQKKLVLCDDTNLLICVASPIPIMLPSTIVDNASFEIDKLTYTFTASERFNGMNPCDLEVLDFTIINDEFETYRYILSKSEGLLYFSVKTQEGAKDGEMFRLSGNVFSYKEFCE